MAIHVNLSSINKDEQEKIIAWTKPLNYHTFYFYRNETPDHSNQIIIYPIHTLFDWIKLSRYKKKHPGIYVIFIHHTLTYSASIATSLHIQYFLSYPLRSTHVYRAFKQILDTHSFAQTIHCTHGHQSCHESLKLIGLRQIVQEELTTQPEIYKILSLFHKEQFPTIVCFLQGFVHLSQQPDVKHRAFSIIRSVFNKQLSEHCSSIYFLPYQRYLLLLLRPPNGTHSIREWEKNFHCLEQAIHTLLQEYQIQIYLGVGSIHEHPANISLSFQEAKQARRHPPFENIHLRFFEEVPKNEVIKTYTHFIEENIREPISAKEVANHMNISYTYFSRCFKKETGKSFSEYLTFLRLRQAVWLLRHTDETIEEIADYIGFNTANYFSSIFKKFIGITPSEYRLSTEIRFQ